ncbi:DUF6053 domain-containing protein [Lysobacter enzymogenes]
MGGASAPMLLSQVAAIRKNSIGAEAPPTKAGARPAQNHHKGKVRRHPT